MPLKLAVPFSEVCFPPTNRLSQPLLFIQRHSSSIVLLDLQISKVLHTAAVSLWRRKSIEVDVGYKGKLCIFISYLTSFCFESRYIVPFCVFSVIWTISPVYHLVFLSGKAADVIHLWLTSTNFMFPLTLTFLSLSLFYRLDRIGFRTHCWCSSPLSCQRLFTSHPEQSTDHPCVLFLKLKFEDIPFFALRKKIKKTEMGANSARVFNNEVAAIILHYGNLWKVL